MVRRLFSLLLCIVLFTSFFGAKLLLHIEFAPVLGGQGFCDNGTSDINA